jgi:hypothetical protein
MTELAQAISRIAGVEIDAGSLETVVLFCGICLAYSLFAIAAYGHGPDLTAF